MIIRYYMKEILMTTSIHLNSSECSKCKNIDGLLKYKLKKEHEKLCNKHGYVLENTLKVVNRSIGKVVTHDNQSMIEYNITMKLNVIYPCEKDIFTVKIDNITKILKRGGVFYFSVPNLYPNPHIVTTIFGSDGLSSIFSLSRLI